MMHYAGSGFPSPNYYPAPGSVRYVYSSHQAKVTAPNLPSSIVLIYFIVWLGLAIGASFILGYIYLRPYWCSLHIAWQTGG